MPIPVLVGAALRVGAGLVAKKAARKVIKKRVGGPRINNWRTNKSATTHGNTRNAVGRSGTSRKPYSN